MNLVDSLPLIEDEDLSLFLENTYDKKYMAALALLFAVEISSKWLFGHERLPTVGLGQGWANYGPRAACGPREHSVRPANTF